MLIEKENNNQVPIENEQPPINGDENISLNEISTVLKQIWNNSLEDM